MFGSQTYTSAQAAVVLVQPQNNETIILRRVSIYCSNANSVNTQGAIGFGARVVAGHPAIAAGSGFVELEPLGQGARGEALTFTCGTPSGGSIQVNYTYDLYVV